MTTRSCSSSRAPTSHAAFTPETPRRCAGVRAGGGTRRADRRSRQLSGSGRLRRDGSRSRELRDRDHVSARDLFGHGPCGRHPGQLREGPRGSVQPHRHRSRACGVAHRRDPRVSTRDCRCWRCPGRWSSSWRQRPARRRSPRATRTGATPRTASWCRGPSRAACCPIRARSRLTRWRSPRGRTSPRSACTATIPQPSSWPVAPAAPCWLRATRSRRSHGPPRGRPHHGRQARRRACRRARHADS